LPVLMVAAPLQIIDSSPRQLWPGTNSSVSIVDALRASLAIPRLFAPTVVTGGDLDHWVEGAPRPARLDLVDGSVVRHNPLPALIRFLSEPQNAEVADVCRAPPVACTWFTTSRFCRSLCPPPAPGRTRSPGCRTLSRRALRANGWSSGETAAWSDADQLRQRDRAHTAFGDGKVSSADVHTITVDEIAPEQELTLENTLQPTETEILTHIADGCRQTLSVLYREQIAEFGSGKPVECGALLHHIAPNRDWRVADRYGMRD